jgi:hypothetical protein
LVQGATRSIEGARANGAGAEKQPQPRQQSEADEKSARDGDVNRPHAVTIRGFLAHA